MRRPLQLLMVLATALAVLAPVQAAEASTTISHVHVSVTHNSMTVTLKSLGSGWRYKLYASTNRADIYTWNLSNGKARHSALVSRPKMTISKLGYTTKLYWYRFVATKGSSRRTSAQYSIGLRPTVPSSVGVSSNAGQGTALTWSNGGVTGLAIQRSDDPAFTTGVVNYSLRDNTQQFSPYGLANGATYYFRVRAINNRTASAWSSVVSAVAQSSVQSVRVGTYNLNNAASGSPAKPWSERRVAGAALVEQAAPDLLAVQEAAGWVDKTTHNAYTGTVKSCPAPHPLRQVDDFVLALGGSYSLAHTEDAPCESTGWFRGANYILYNPNTYSIVDAGHFVIDTIDSGSGPTQKWAAWVIAQNKTSGAKLLFVGPHVTPNLAKGCSNWDVCRQRETHTLIQDANQLAASNGNLPIVYAGDYNSNSKHPLDGPAVEMRAAHNADSEYAAPSRTNAKYDSANKYMTTPPAFGDDIDHVYASPGVSLRAWALWMKMSSGKLVSPIPSDHHLLTTDVDFPY